MVMTAKTIDQPTEQRTISSISVTGAQIWHWAPSVLWLAAAALFLLSISLPYWRMVLFAPQYPESLYPGGLQMNVYVHKIEGNDATTVNDISEIDGLNHYIGMKPLGDAAALERSIAIPTVILFSIFLAVAALWRRKWVWVVTIPPLAFPLVFLADLAVWMYHYGHSLSPSAALSSSIGAFTPTLLGEGVIAQFRSMASLQSGWFVAAGGSGLVVIALVLVFIEHRRMQKSLEIKSRGNDR